MLQHNDNLAASNLGGIAMAAIKTIAGTGYGNAYVDALIWGGRVWDSNWKDGGKVPINIHLADPSELEAFKAARGGDSGMIYSSNTATMRPWNADEWNAWRWAKSLYMGVCNVNIAFSTSTDPDYYDIASWKVDVRNGPDQLSGAHETLPESTKTQIWGYYNPHAPGWPRMTPGGDGLSTIIHELGHGLGLAHPHDGGTAADMTKFPGVTGESDLGTHQLNQQIYTVMSYNLGWDAEPATLEYGQQMGLGAFDIAALQAIYGANTLTAREDNVYTLPTKNQVGTGWFCIWDAGGDDTISAAQSPTGVSIDLRAATLADNDPNAGGFVSWQYNVAGGFTIAKNVVIENAVGGKDADSISGNEVGNKLTGNAGDDVLDGLQGADTMDGGAGNDSYDVDNPGDVIIDSSGHDKINTAISYILPGHIEDLDAYGNAAVSLTGNDLDNTIYGNKAANFLTGKDGHDTLNGGQGVDTMSGGAGNDVYYVDDPGDVIIDTSGYDVVYAPFYYPKPDGIENVIVEWTAPPPVKDPVLNYKLSGNSGRDILTGGAGNDKLDGGYGNDVLTGGGGKDTFLFKTRLHKSKNVDKIMDFNPKYDTIWLDDKIFKKVGKGTESKPGKLLKSCFTTNLKALDADDAIIYDRPTGTLYCDTNGSETGGRVAFARLINKPKLTLADFMIV